MDSTQGHARQGTEEDEDIQMGNRLADVRFENKFVGKNCIDSLCLGFHRRAGDYHLHCRAFQGDAKVIVATEEERCYND
jgi:hypothetical protein